MAQESIRKVTNLQELKQERKKAAHRQRRIIFNNDGNDVVYYCKEATREALLACRTTPLLGSQVDSIFYCTWSSSFMFTHRTRVAEVFDCMENPERQDNKIGGFSKNKTAEFIRQGTDSLEIMVDFCRKNNLEIFWSFRLNDIHDSSWETTWYGKLMFSQLKKDHPEWLVGSMANRPKYGAWSSLDFGHQEVRNLVVKIIEEVCENYDIDGIEMDFLRHPMYFKGPAWGQDAETEEIEKMTEMIRRVRKATEQAGLKRGRPILVGIRVPDSVECCEAIGLDIIRWLEEDLIDLLAVSCYFRLNEWEVSVCLGHKYGVPVYPCLSETRIQDREAAKVRGSIECYRSRAMNVWDSGADGVYLFNLFNPRHPVWRELGDRKMLETMDKVYVVSVRSVKGYGNLNYWIADGERRFRKRSTLSPESPVPLNPGETVAVDLCVGEEVRPKGDKTPQVTLRLRVQALPDAAEMSVKLNNNPLSEWKKSEEWLECSLSPTFIRRGANCFECALKPESAAKPILQDLQIWVRYK